MIVLENNRAWYVSTLCSSLENAPLLTTSLQGAGVNVNYGTLDLVGCKFLGNSATNSRGDDIYTFSTVNIDGCPAGSSGAAGAALDTYTIGSGATITGEAKSYSCGACVR